MAYRRFVGEYTDKSDKITSSPEWKVIEGLYEAVEPNNSAIALKADHTCTFKGLLIKGDQAGGLTYGGESHVHMVPFGESKFSADVAFPSGKENNGWSWFKSVNIVETENGSKRVTCVLKYYNGSEFINSDAFSFTLVPSKGELPDTAIHALSVSEIPEAFVTASGIQTYLDEHPITFYAYDDDEFHDEITMYRRRMDRWASEMLNVFAGQGVATVIEHLVFDGAKLMDIKPFNWNERVKGGNDGLKIFHEPSVTKLPTEALITEPATGILIAAIAPGNDTAKLYNQEEVIRTQFGQ
jgi:hypothetical protein